MNRPLARVLSRAILYQFDGKLYVHDDDDVWAEVIVVPPGECDHSETMCLSCLKSWDTDWIIELKHPDDEEWYRYDPADDPTL